jgi:plasmid maintenance system killer protein
VFFVGLQQLFAADDVHWTDILQLRKLRTRCQQFNLHQLKGGQKGIWSITISGNWRITFRFDESGAKDVDLIDYH